jgi:hypothetical protein
MDSPVRWIIIIPERPYYCPYYCPISFVCHERRRGRRRCERVEGGRCCTRILYNAASGNARSKVLVLSTLNLQLT